MKQRLVLGQSQAKVLHVVREAGPRGADRRDVIAGTGLRSGHPSLKYAIESLQVRGLIEEGTDGRYRATGMQADESVAGQLEYSDMLMIYYLGSFKKTGQPIVIKNPASGRMIICDHVVFNGHIEGDMRYGNAPPGIQAQGPTTLLLVRMFGGDVE